MNKYIVYFTTGAVAHVTADRFDWGYSKEDTGIWFYDDEEYIVAWFPSNYVMGVNCITSVNRIEEAGDKNA